MNQHERPRGLIHTLPEETRFQRVIFNAFKDSGAEICRNFLL